MRSYLLASVAVFALGGTAFAQNSNSPMSTSASNITASDTHSAMAPRLPVSAVDASANQFLTDAQRALHHGRTGAAQESLERAETRLLSRSTEPSMASMPDSGAKIAAIKMARDDLAHGDRKGAMQSIETALSAKSAMAMPPASMGATTMSNASVGAAPPPWPGPAPAPETPPNSLGGIATSVGGDNGTGAQTRPQASFSGPATAPPVMTDGAPASP